VFSPTATGLNHPWGLAFDHDGNLWVADYGEGRVLQYGGPSATVTTSSSAPGPTTSAMSTGLSSTAPVTTPPSNSSSGGGGIPEYPGQFVVAAVFSALLVASYLLARARAPPHEGGDSRQ